MWQHSAPPRWQSYTGPRVAIQYTTTLAIMNRAACGNIVHHHAGNQEQGRVWQYTLESPGPVLRRTRCGVRRNRVALTHANYSQRRVWQARWQSVPRVAMHAGNQCRVWQCMLAIRKGGRVWQSRGYQCRAWLALCADPEPQNLSPLDVSVGGRTPGRRSLGSKIPQTRQWFVRTPVQPQ